jgi:hypothetical protein
LRAGRSCPMGDQAGTIVVVAIIVGAQRQLSVGTTVSTPQVADLEGTLAVARTLLHNPPCLEASLGAEEQW